MADLGMTVGLIKALAPKPDAATIKAAVTDWLDDHPEATTTVQDGSITKAKLDSNLKETVDDVGELKTAKAAAIHVVSNKHNYSDLSAEPIDSNGYTLTVKDVNTAYNKVVVADSEIVVSEPNTLNTYESNGLTFSIEDGVVTVNGTSTAGTSCRFRYNGGNSIPLKKEIKAGDSVTFGVLYTNGTSSTNYNTTLTLAGSQEIALLNYVTTPSNAEKTVTASSDSTTVGMSFYTGSGKTFDNLKIYPYVIIGTMESFQMSAVDDGNLTIKSSDLTGFTQIYTPLFGHSLSYNADTKAYVDAHTPDYDFDKIVYSREYYVSPEMFGAKGDGTTDDTTAINAAIAYGIANGCAVRGYRSYKTTGTVVIDGIGADVYIKKINYTGATTAVKISGQRNHIAFGVVYALTSGAKAITFSTREGVYTQELEFSCDSIMSDSHCLYFFNEDGSDADATSYIMSGNLIKCRHARSISGRIFHNDTAVAETTCVMGNLSNDVGYAFYSYQGNTAIQQANLESCHAGFLVKNGGFILYNVRVAEMTNKQRYDSEDPTTGMLFSVVEGGKGWIVNSNESPLSDVLAVDVSGRSTTPHSPLNNYEYAVKVGRFRRYYNYYYLPNGDENYSGNMLIWGTMTIYANRIAYVPDVKTALTVTTDTHVEDMKHVPPYRIIAGADGVKVYLGDTYCPYGISEFTVDQTEHTCLIYDRDDQLVFDGSEYGTGVFDVKIMPVDPPTSASTVWGWVIGQPLQYFVSKVNDVV